MNQTTNCIICYKKAILWTGHVHYNLFSLDSERVLAGFCKEHETKEIKTVVKLKGCSGCFGNWNVKMGYVDSHDSLEFDWLDPVDKIMDEMGYVIHKTKENYGKK